MMSLQLETLFSKEPMGSRKRLGQFFTPSGVAKSLTEWAVRAPTDALLDPSCGNGEFLSFHARSTGIELSTEVWREALNRVPTARILNADFFGWARRTLERFDAAVGNPPFIRYQSFKGQRSLALEIASANGVKFSGLTSSWAPFLVVAAGLLKAGGRLAFVVPAELGHATYSVPLIEFLATNFSFVQVIAIRNKIFPKLSEDAWLLYADGYGGKCDNIALSLLSSFQATPDLPKPSKAVAVQDWRRNGRRLRKFLLPNRILAHYEELSSRKEVVTLGSVARTSIGYVTGRNSFFHLKPSQARELHFPEEYLRVAVTNGEQLRQGRVDQVSVNKWLKEDKRVLLIDLFRARSIPPAVRAYLDSAEGIQTRTAFKCRNRHPWYVVPNIEVPDAFLTYMNGTDPMLIPNDAGCVCTNSLIAVRLTNGIDAGALARAWSHPLARLSQELEGHPLGGGMLKLEPGEAARVKLPIAPITDANLELLNEGVRLMRRWRHYHDA